MRKINKNHQLKHGYLKKWYVRFGDFCFYCFLPLFLIVLLQTLCYAWIQDINQYSFKHGYVDFSVLFHLHLDDLIPYHVGVDADIIYSYLTSVAIYLIPIMIYIMCGKRFFNWWFWLNLIVLIVSILFGILFPTYDVLSNNDVADNTTVTWNWMCCPSFHIMTWVTRFFGFYFVARKTKNKYFWWITWIILSLSIWCQVETWFIKAHYILDGVFSWAIGILIYFLLVKFHIRNYYATMMNFLWKKTRKPLVRILISGGGILALVFVLLLFIRIISCYGIGFWDANSWIFIMSHWNVW
jgi:hypothetical protein